MADAARFDEMLSQARNGRLSLTFLHQYQAQLSEQVRSALFGNVGNLISFQVGPDDATHLEGAFNGEINANQLTGLGRHEIAVKRPPTPGRTGLPFFAVTLPPTAERAGYHDAIVKESRRRFARPKVKAERAIAHFLASEKEKRIAALARTMKQKPTFSPDSPGARFTKLLNELRPKPHD